MEQPRQRQRASSSMATFRSYDVTFNISGTGAPPVGYYRMINYTGGSSISGLTIGTTPPISGLFPVTYAIDSSRAHVVDLVASPNGMRAVAPGEAFRPCRLCGRAARSCCAIAAGPRSSACFRPSTPSSTLGIDPADACPDHWRHVHNRLGAGYDAAPYSRDQHRAWLLRRRIDCHDALRLRHDDVFRGCSASAHRRCSVPRRG